MSQTSAPYHVLLVVGDPTGGIRRHVHSLIRGIDKAKFNVSYAYDDSAADSAFYKEIGGLKSDLVSSMAFKVHKSPHPTDAINIYQLRRFVMSQHIDIIHGHGAKAGLYARVVGLMTGIPSVYTPHGGVAHDMFSRVTGWVYQTIERILAPFTGQFIFESQYTANAMTKRLGYAPKNAVVNDNGVELLTVDASLVEDAKIRMSEIDGSSILRFGVFGMLRDQKGQSVAISALRILRQKNLPVSLHLFGDGPAKEFLKQKSLDDGVSDVVFFHGDTSPIEPWMCAVDVVVIPSLFESFGYVAVEAMMLQRPIIASMVGGLKDILTDDVAMLVPSEDPVLLSDAMLACIHERTDLQSMSQRAKSRAQSRFTLNAMINGVQTVYSKLMQRSNT